MFAAADQVLIREHVPLGFDPPRRTVFLRPTGGRSPRPRVDAQAYPTPTLFLKHWPASARRGDVVVILSNGGFDAIHERLLVLLGQAA